MNLFYVNNTSDIRALRSAVKSLENALAIERNLADRLEQQRDSQILEASVYANLARSLAKKLDIPREQMLKLRDECKASCEADLRQRGLKNFAETPPKFTVKVK